MSISFPFFLFVAGGFSVKLATSPPSQAPLGKALLSAFGGWRLRKAVQLPVVPPATTHPQKQKTQKKIELFMVKKDP